MTETLPTTAYVTSGGADVLQEAQPYAQNLINAFNRIGSPPPAPATTTTTTTTPTEAHSLVGVDVLNASTLSGVAHTTAAALTSQGFDVTGIGNASTPLTGGGPSEILYGRSGSEAAHTLASVLSGPVTLVSDPSLSGQTVTLLVAGSPLTVTGSSGVAASTTTTTTTTIPSDVYTNKQLEPWNPFPCTIGQPTQATPTTAPKTVKKK